MKLPFTDEDAWDETAKGMNEGNFMSWFVFGLRVLIVVGVITADFLLRMA